MAHVASFNEQHNGTGVIGWLSLGSSVVLAAILVLSALATSQENNAAPINDQTSAAAE